jgi:hypothetical protein
MPEDGSEISDTPDRKDRRFGEILSKAQFRSDFLKEGNTSADVHETVVNYSHPFWRFDRNAAWRTVPIDFQLGFDGDQKGRSASIRAASATSADFWADAAFSAALMEASISLDLFVGSGSQASGLDEEAGPLDSQHNCKYRNDCVGEFEFEEVSDPIAGRVLLFLFGLWCLLFGMRLRDRGQLVVGAGLCVLSSVILLLGWGFF